MSEIYKRRCPLEGRGLFEFHIVVIFACAYAPRMIVIVGNHLESWSCEISQSKQHSTNRGDHSNRQRLTGKPTFCMTLYFATQLPHQVTIPGSHHASPPPTRTSCVDTLWMLWPWKFYYTCFVRAMIVLGKSVQLFEKAARKIRRYGEVLDWL